MVLYLIMAKSEKRALTLVLTGKSGAGKSTLMDILVRGKATQRRSAAPVTDRFVAEEFTKNEVDIRIIDTPGLMGEKEDSKELKMCSVFTEGKADLLVYCLSVAAGHKFHDNNPEIIKSLAEGYETQIWNHCILVLTMSNNAIRTFERRYPNQAAEEYKKFLKEHSTRFEKQLRSLEIEKCVKTVFELDEAFKDDITNTIIAVPAGKTPHNQVLPGLEYSLPDYCEKNWISVLIDMMRAKCTAESAPLLLQYQYGEGKYATPGAIAGGIVGGLLLPVFGAIPGAAIGYKAGLAIGKQKTAEEKEHIQQELTKRQSKETTIKVTKQE